MARRPVIGSGTLNPFGGSGVSFDAFNVAASMGEQAYLQFRKKEVQWEAGQLTDDDYLAALQAYGAALPEGSEKFNAQQRYEDTKSRLTRNRLIGDISDGTKQWSDLLTYDLNELGKATATGGQTYDERLGNVRDDQGRIFSDEEDVVRQKYNDGKMTAAQLKQWYQDKLDSDLTANNPELDKQITKRVGEVGDVVLQERDQKMVSDFNAGKVGYNSFVAYGNTARARYDKGTQQYDDWTERLTNAKDQAIEQSITYRYGLSQRYDDLARFIKDHGTAPTGHTTTSTSGGRKGSTRLIWNGSKWVETRVGATSGGTKTTYHGPSASEQKAWADVQQQVKQAKAEMARIQSTISRQPGGWVSTDDMIRYYSKVQAGFAVGSAEWYSAQERLDGLQQQKAKEKVFATKGLKVSYPRYAVEHNEFGTTDSKGHAAPGNLPPQSKPASTTTVAKAQATYSATAVAQATTPTAGASQRSGDKAISIDQFMRAIASVESGGRYDAVNKSSGARGKYQIMPSNWSGWAAKYLGNAKAAMTPANQEKVVKGKMLDLYHWLKDWRAVAHWWLTGGGDANVHRDPNQWSSSSRSYVNKVFAGLGMSPTQVSRNAYTAAGGGGATPSAPSGATAGYRGTAPTGSPRPHVGGGATAPVTVHQAETAADSQPFRIPTGLDAAQFERFYHRFLDAYESGDLNFVDYSTGRAINYMIPTDLEERSKLVSYLDDVRIGAFAAKAKAYSGTPSGLVAATQYSDAVKKAGENLMLVLDTNQYPPRGYVAPGGQLIRTNKTPAPSPKTSLNPVAEGLKLKDHIERMLANSAASAKAALKRGDLEAAYSFVQIGLDAAATGEGQLQQYMASAQSAIHALRQTGAKVPAAVQSDLKDLQGGMDFDLQGGASPGYASALQSLEETTSEIEKYVQFDANDEPVRKAGLHDDDEVFKLKGGVALFLQPNGEVKYEQSRVTDLVSGARDNKQYVTVAVKVGTSVKQAQAKWEAAPIGVIKGTTIPIYGRMITGQIDGQEYVWVENPFAAGKWIRTQPGKPLQIDAPASMTPFKNPDGTWSLEFQSGARGQSSKYRLQFNDQDGTYHVMQPPGLFSGSGEWVDQGSASSSQDIAQLYGQAGWKVESTDFQGEDAHFFNSSTAWVGFSQSEHERAIRNTQSSRTTTGGPSFNPAYVQPAGRHPTVSGGPSFSPGYVAPQGAKPTTSGGPSFSPGYVQPTLPPRAADADERAISGPALPPIRGPQHTVAASAARHTTPAPVKKAAPKTQHTTAAPRPIKKPPAGATRTKQTTTRKSTVRRAAPKPIPVVTPSNKRAFSEYG